MSHFPLFMFYCIIGLYIVPVIGTLACFYFKLGLEAFLNGSLDVTFPGELIRQRAVNTSSEEHLYRTCFGPCANQIVQVRAQFLIGLFPVLLDHPLQNMYKLLAHTILLMKMWQGLDVIYAKFLTECFKFF